MPRMQAVFYRDVEGNEPVDEFLGSLPVRQQVVLDNQIDRLNMLKPEDPRCRFPTRPRSAAS